MIEKSLEELQIIEIQPFIRTLNADGINLVGISRLRQDWDRAAVWLRMRLLQVGYHAACISMSSLG